MNEARTLVVDVILRETQAGQYPYAIQDAANPELDVCIGDRYVRRSNQTVETIFKIVARDDSVAVWSINSKSHDAYRWHADSILQLIEDGALVRERFVTQDEQVLHAEV